jgi:hypothetical protein
MYAPDVLMLNFRQLMALTTPLLNYAYARSTLLLRLS